MNGADFYDKVEAHPDLELVGASYASEIKPVLDVPGTERVLIVRYVPRDEFYQITAGAVEREEWGTLEKVLTGKWESDVLDQMSRIVGYYSSTRSWNKSKLGELADRRKGEYKIP